MKLRDLKNKLKNLPKNTELFIVDTDNNKTTVAFDINFIIFIKEHKLVYISTEKYSKHIIKKPHR